ncbi:MAG: immunoglobulin domain-containing protein, partial [Bacteroidetes bacterium]|nr:immunoglobulin domain-containing protein [Bacteroidota bacterium]
MKNNTIMVKHLLALCAIGIAFLAIPQKAIGQCSAGTVNTSSASICSGSSPGTIDATVATGTGAIIVYTWVQSTVSAAGPWSSASGTNSNEDYVVPNLTTTTYYKRIATDVVGTCGAQSSATVTFTVTSVTTITSQPSDVTECNGDNTSFTLAATGSGLTYQWQVDNGGGYANLANVGIYSGATATTLNLTGVSTGNNGYSYRCLVSSTACPIDTTVEADLAVMATPTVTVDPVSITVCEAVDSSFSVTATGTALTYRWQVDNGGGFANLSNGGGYSGTTSATLTLSNISTTLDGYLYRCVASNTACPSDFSTSATLTVFDQPTITADPSDATVCVNDDPTFTVTATGTSITYQWQEDNGGGYTNISNGGVYSGATTATLTLTDVVAGMNGYAYRCVVDNAHCNPDISASADLTIQLAPTVTSNPSDVTDCEDEDISFSVTATGTALTYQWQEDNGGGFANLANGGSYSGVNTATLSITSISSSLDGYDYRVVIDNAGCVSTNSNTANLDVVVKPTVTADPSNVTVCENDDPSFTIVATGDALTYQWQEDDGGGYANISNGGVYSGATTATLTLTNITAGMDGYLFRCVVDNANCDPDMSAAASATVRILPVVTADPSDFSICDGDDAGFKVTATGTSLTYQWQEDNGGGYANLANGVVYSGVTTDELTLTDPSTGRDAYTYRCVVSGVCAPSATSNEGLLTVQVPPSISVQAGDQTICEDGNASFSVTAGGSSITYQWQEDDGSGYSNIADGGVYGGATTANLTLTAAPSTMNGYDYRVVVDNSECPSVTGNAVSLTTNLKPSISASPSNATVCVDDDPTFTVTATGTGITYQWQEDNGGGFANLTNNGTYSGVTIATLTITDASAGMSGYDYRCVVSGTCTPSATSSSADLTVQTPPTVTTDPSDATVCEDADPTFTVVASGTSLTYQWQEDDGTGYANLSDGGIYSGTNTAMLTLTDVTNANDGYTYRCLVDNSACASDISGEADIIVNTAPAITASPSNATVCATGDPTYTITATGTSLTYQWQEDNGGGFANLANNGTYSGVTTTTLTITDATAGMDGYDYRCVVSGTCTPSATSSSASLTVQTAPNVTADPSDATVCVNDDPSFTVTATGSSLTYQWQVDNGGGFANIANGGVYSGATTLTLTLTDVTAGMDGYDYRCVVSGACIPSDFSASASLAVHTVPTFTVNPSSTNYCTGDDIVFTTTVSGSSLGYQWQEDNGGGFSNLSNNATYSGVNTTSLTISSAGAGLDGYDYRLVATNTGCGSTNSSSATISNSASPSVTISPSDATVCVNGDPTFSITASGASLTYQWQEDNGAGFTNLANGGVYSTVTTAMLTITDATAAMNGYDYRCVVSSGTCPSATSASANLTVNSPPSISTNPANTAACIGDNITFSVVATGTGLTYQWQEDQGSGFSNLANGGSYSNVTTADLDISGITAGFDGFMYRVLISGTCTPTATSSSATLSTISNVSISAQPSAVTTCVDGDPTFTVAASGGTISYQWQEDDGSGYANLANGGIYSGVTTFTLTLTDVTASMDDYTYRCRVSSTCGSDVTSNDAQLDVDIAPVVTANPSDATKCASDAASFTVTAAIGTNLTYQWQEDDGSGFSNLSNGGIYSGALTATLSLSSVSAGMNGYDYRCVVTNTGCGSATSASANLAVNSPPAITTQPTDITVCEGSNTGFSVTATGAGLTYQWQENKGSGFSAISNGGVYGGATSANLTFTGVTSSMTGYVYRCVVTGTCNPSVTSDEIDLTVQTIPSVTVDPVDDAVCAGGNGGFTVTATGSSLTYQWQEDDGGGYADLSNGGIYSGATTASLALTGATAGMDGYTYRCVVDNSECSADLSGNGELTVQVSPAVTVDPVDDAVCAGGNGGFTVTATGSSLTYQWQEDDG